MADLSIDEFLADRQAALLSMDMATVNAFMRKYGSPKLPDDETGWAAVHKARTAIIGFPAGEKAKSAEWLAARGMRSMS